MTDFGTDVSSYPDLDTNFGAITDLRAVGECCARMLETPRGSLVYAPDRGYDLRSFLNESVTQAKLDQVKRAIEQECEKDERVASAAATLVFTFATQTLDVSIQLTTNDGPFVLVLQVTAVTLTIIDGGT